MPGTSPDRPSRVANTSPFPASSFFLGGFECSSHRLNSGRRLDMLTATRHIEFAAADYRRLRAAGIRAARDGLRWHVIEKTPGNYDFSSAEPLIQAAGDEEVSVVW